ncbi:MAG TPA: aldo/keto reductase family protein [Stackebrandtia sp.]|uniref:aldo/keto reductase family protein n=1 Tax=Stackebrandtia sp. TaxID=2023065 RepID=UPI002D42F671|nr:aldo/keto reductase family protein [Stackebrandtia sp.]HZE41474.1 aldo/keto reductase family protein [Stackebrandtia sp.]
MEYRNLGRSGLKISAITYGNWLPGGDPKAAKECVAAALDAGVNSFDTADIYGRPDFGAGERVLGEALAGVRRESVVIGTKVCLPVGDGPNDRGLSRKHITESCHASLRRLGTDHIDLYQAHRFDADTPLEETMVAFADLVHQGHVGYIGVSEWTAPRIRVAAALATELRIPLVSNQPQYSMLWRIIEPQVVPACEELGLSQIVFSPLAQGVLTGKYPPGRPAPTDTRAGSERGADFVGRYMSEAVLSAVQRLRPIAEELGTNLARLALAWVLGRPNVASAVMGASRPDQIRDNVAALELSLDDEVCKRIDEALVDPGHGDLVERDADKTARMFDVMPAWRR